MYLIPLHDGTWTLASRQSIFFSKSETSLEIPSSIKVLIVDSTAESDPNRRKLFTSLGVKAWEAPEICCLVLKVHESSDFDPKSLTVDQLISHAAFLYKASWQPPKTADLWFATIQDERCMGRKLYIPGSIETNSPAARIFAQLQKEFAVIHSDYLEAFPLDADWPIWLVNNLGLSKVPRLVTPHVKPQPQPAQTLTIHGSAKTNGDVQMKDLSDSVASDQELPDRNSASNQGKTTVVGSLDVLQDFDLDSFLNDDNPPPHPLSRTTAFQTPQDDQMPLMLLEEQNKQEILASRRLTAQQKGKSIQTARPGRRLHATPRASNPQLREMQQQQMILQQRQQQQMTLKQWQQRQQQAARQAMLAQQYSGIPLMDMPNGMNQMAQFNAMRAGPMARPVNPPQHIQLTHAQAQAQHQVWNSVKIILSVADVSA
jgi:hypothetical protein